MADWKLGGSSGHPALRRAALAALAALVISSFWTASVTAQDTSGEVNRIIQGLTEKPRDDRAGEVRTRGLTRSARPQHRTRGAKSTANIVCEDALSRVSAATRAAKKDINILDDCIAERPKMDFKVEFELNSHALTAAARRVLDDLGRALEHPTLENADFIVAGHTDSRGSRPYNQGLSKLRAESVRAYLQENYRVRGKQLVVVGYAFDRLLNLADPYADENRRVEIIRR